MWEQKRRGKKESEAGLHAVFFNRGGGHGEGFGDAFDAAEFFAHKMHCAVVVVGFEPDGKVPFAKHVVSGVHAYAFRGSFADLVKSVVEGFGFGGVEFYENKVMLFRFAGGLHKSTVQIFGSREFKDV